MIAITIESEDHKHDGVIVILEPENLVRLKQADPVEVNLRKLGKHLVNPKILICLEENVKELEKVMENGDLKKLIKYLTRGWKYQPGDGKEPVRIFP